MSVTAGIVRMGISSVIESDHVLNTVEAGDSFSDILTFVTQNIDSWGSRHHLWDMTRFDFESVNSHAVHSFIRNGTKLSLKHAGRKTAILVNSEVAFGMTRMVQLLSEGKFKFEMGVFRDQDKALAWLKED
jgi:hypothetical protein